MEVSEIYRELLADAEERMEKSIEVFKEQIRGIRSGRAHVSLVDHIKVHYYGSPVKIRELANIGVSEPNMLVIKPYDPSCLGDIEKAILKSNIGITPQNDGKVLRLIIPPLSEETRQKLVNHAKDFAEEARVSCRNIRRDVLKKAEQKEKAKELTEDELMRLKEEVTDLLKKKEKEIEELLQQKIDELMHN